MKKVLCAALLAASALISAKAAHATAYDNYSTKTSFISNVTGLNAYTFGPISGSETALGNSWTLGSVSFSSDSPLFLENTSGVFSLKATGDSVTVTPTGGKAIGFLLTSANSLNKIGVDFNGLGSRNFSLSYTDGVAFFGLNAFTNVTSITLSNFGGELHLFDVETNGAFLPQEQVAAAPEPSSLALLGTGVLGVGGMVRRRFTRA